MEAYQERVFAEKRELDERMEKLIAFIGSEKFDGLTADKQERMKKQRSIMIEYSTVLGERIAAFKD